jgi:hypothetical protein
MVWSASLVELDSGGSKRRKWSAALSLCGAVFGSSLQAVHVLDSNSGQYQVQLRNSDAPTWGRPRGFRANTGDLLGFEWPEGEAGGRGTNFRPADASSVQHFNERELREIRSDKTGRGARASGKKNVRGRTRLTCQTVQQIKAARSAASPTVNVEMVDRASGVVKVRGMYGSAYYLQMI